MKIACCTHTIDEEENDMNSDIYPGDLIKLTQDTWLDDVPRKMFRNTVFYKETLFLCVGRTITSNVGYEYVTYYLLHSDGLFNAYMDYVARFEKIEES